MDDQLSPIAGLMAACYVPFIWAASVALAEPLAVPLIAVQLLLALKLMAKSRVPSRWLLFAFGLLSAVVGLTRPAIPLAYLAISRFKQWRQVGVLIAYAALGFVLVMAPWWIRNARVIGVFVPVRTDAVRTASGAYESIGSDSGATPPATLREKFDQVSAAALGPWCAPDDVTWEGHFRNGGQTGINIVPYTDAANTATHNRLVPWQNVSYIYQACLLALAAVGLLFSVGVPRLGTRGEECGAPPRRLAPQADPVRHSSEGGRRSSGARRRAHRALRHRPGARASRRFAG